MVNYKLGVVGRKEGRVIDLDSILKLKKLDDLDEFTSAFKNEEELKYYLFNQELISNEEMNKSFKVLYKYNGKVKKLPIVYNDMKKYLNDTWYLKYSLQALSSDVEFLEKLANHYSLGDATYNPQGLNVSDIRTYLSEVRKNNGEVFYSKFLEVALDDLLMKAVFKLDTKTGEAKENYRGQRDLAILVYKYYKKLEEKEAKNKESSQEKSWVQSSLLDLMPENNNVTSIDEKENDGKWVLSSEGEPDFPPNSEEEANYLRYLEELEEKTNFPIEEHDHYRR